VTVRLNVRQEKRYLDQHFTVTANIDSLPLDSDKAMTWAWVITMPLQQHTISLVVSHRCHLVGLILISPLRLAMTFEMTLARLMPVNQLILCATCYGLSERMILVNSETPEMMGGMF
jgi:hypothetical protein